jgi:hypothetical protein
MYLRGLVAVAVCSCSLARKFIQFLFSALFLKSILGLKDKQTIFTLIASILVRRDLCTHYQSRFLNSWVVDPADIWGCSGWPRCAPNWSEWSGNTFFAVSISWGIGCSFLLWFVLLLLCWGRCQVFGRAWGRFAAFFIWFFLSVVLNEMLVFWRWAKDRFAASLFCLDTKAARLLNFIPK